MRDHARDIMVDIETLSSRNNAAIIQIGACTFDEKDTFLVNIPEEWYDQDQLDAMDYHLSASTISWWESQGEEAKESLRMEPLMSLPDALKEFSEWVESTGFKISYSGKPGVWANPPQFDFTILRNAYMTEFAKVTPWHYRQERCARTLWREFPSAANTSRVDDSDLIEHRADHDAIRQARSIRQILKNLSGE